MIRTIALIIFANIFITANALNIDSLNIRIYTEEVNTYHIKEVAKKFDEIRKSANFAKFVNNINDGDTLYLLERFYKEHPEKSILLGCNNFKFI